LRVDSLIHFRKRVFEFVENASRLPPHEKGRALTPHNCCARVSALNRRLASIASLTSQVPGVRMLFTPSACAHL